MIEVKTVELMRATSWLAFVVGAAALDECVEPTHQRIVRSAVGVAGDCALVASPRSGSASGRSPALLDLDDATSTVVVDRRGVPLYEALSGDGTRSVHLDRRACPRASSRRRLRPRIAASGRIPASIRSRSRARCGRTCRGTDRRGRIDDHAAGRQAAAQPPVAEARRGACARRSARPCSRCGSSIGSTSARSSRCT